MAKVAVTKSTKTTKATKAVKTVASEAKEAGASTGLTVSVLGTDGKVKGKMTLPAEVFAQKASKALLAQAIRVYQANQREGSASTKTRGEVEGSTRKIYRQKGTGRARHGSIRAHIFVGGGVVFGPVPHSFTLQMPEKMRRKALTGALTSQLEAGRVIVMDGLEAVTKTKSMAQALVAASAVKNVLLVVGKDATVVTRAARNIEGVDIVPSTSLNTYTVLAHQKIVFMKDAVAQLKTAVAGA
jgi:large subunit ribosomal protein L4